MKSYSNLFPVPRHPVEDTVHKGWRLGRTEALRQLHCLINSHAHGNFVGVQDLARPDAQDIAVDGGNLLHRPFRCKPGDDLIQPILIIGDALDDSLENILETTALNMAFSLLFLGIFFLIVLIPLVSGRV